ncbi:MAG: glutathione S-transferase family protein [Pseudohongiellaceae bacterium]|nr:glutathione S-transferase family protein [Pseudohongiellaceae bacterium]
MSNLKYQLYGAPISYYTGKVRSYFKWKQIPYEETLSTAQVYKNIIVPRVGFPVIPVVVSPEDETLQDSTHIMDTLEQRFPQRSIYPTSPVQHFVAILLEIYGDEWLVIPAMHYRWHHNRDWAIEQFGATNAPNATKAEQKQIGEKRAQPFAKAALMLGAEPHMYEAIEKSYEDLLAELDAHFAEHQYLLGARASIADFGLFGPLYAHQFRDPKSGELMRRLAPNLLKWIERMCEPKEEEIGEFLADDAIAPTLLPILRRMMREQLPALRDLSTGFGAWLAENPNTDIPRVIGFHSFELEGKTGSRIMRVYSLWMMQRARDAYKSLNALDKGKVDSLLEAIDGGAFKDFQDPPRLERAGMSVKLQ